MICCYPALVPSAAVTPPAAAAKIPPAPFEGEPVRQWSSLENNASMRQQAGVRRSVEER